MHIPTLAELLTQCDITATRASGPGGQHVNKTDSAVQVLHRPTGIQLKVGESRSQHTNKQIALERLQKLLEQRQIDQEQRLAAIRFKHKPKRRPRSVKEKILKSKKHNSLKKSLRGPVP